MVISLQCAKTGCAEIASHGNTLCELHLQELDESHIAECEHCHNFFDISLELGDAGGNAHLCVDCIGNMKTPEHATQHNHIYILTLDGGDFYIGQTANLGRQLKGHYDGNFHSTAGKNPQLVWSEQWTGDNSKIQESMHNLAILYSENPSAMLHKLQARLPRGGFHWG